MQQREDKFKRKTAQFRLSSVDQNVPCLSSLFPLQSVSAESYTWKEISIQLSCHCHLGREGPVSVPVSKFP